MATDPLLRDSIAYVVSIETLETGQVCTNPYQAETFETGAGLGRYLTSRCYSLHCLSLAHSGVLGGFALGSNHIIQLDFT